MQVVSEGSTQYKIARQSSSLPRASIRESSLIVGKKIREVILTKLLRLWAAATKQRFSGQAKGRKNARATTLSCGYLGTADQGSSNRGRYRNGRHQSFFLQKHAHLARYNNIFPRCALTTSNAPLGTVKMQPQLFP
jgi:hypothetical protein